MQHGAKQQPPAKCQLSYLLSHHHCSFVGSSPHAVVRVGDDCPLHGDPLKHLEAALAGHTLLHVPSVRLPAFTGGAVGYVAYDAVRHFEPRTAPALAAQDDALRVPESVFQLVDALVVFDHVRHTIKVVAHARLAPLDGGDAIAAGASADAAAYAAACRRIDDLCVRLSGPLPRAYSYPCASAPPAAPATPLRAGSTSFDDAGDSGGLALPPTAASAAATASAEVPFDWEASSNVGKRGYEGMVTGLQAHIVDGDIIQAVPSQRVRRRLPEGVTAFDIYRQLRVVNPSPYMFYVDAGPGLQVRMRGCGGWAGGGGGRAGHQATSRIHSDSHATRFTTSVCALATRSSVRRPRCS